MALMSLGSMSRSSEMGGKSQRGTCVSRFSSSPALRCVRCLLYRTCRAVERNHGSASSGTASRRRHATRNVSATMS